MRREVPARASELASRLAALFRSDSELAERLNDAQRRLRRANDRLWSGLHPDALGLVYDDGRQAAVHAGASMLGNGGRGGGAEVALLVALQQTHWTIHRAFCDYQTACAERRRLAVDVGELSGQLIEALCAAGWSEEAARSADVHELATAGAR